MNLDLSEFEEAKKENKLKIDALELALDGLSPEFKTKFKKLWSETEGLNSADFEKNFDNPKKTPNQNLLYRVSKYLALEVVNAISKSDDPSEIIADLINYASSSTNDSAVFVKAS